MLCASASSTSQSCFQCLSVDGLLHVCVSECCSCVCICVCLAIWVAGCSFRMGQDLLKVCMIQINLPVLIQYVHVQSIDYLSIASWPVHAHTHICLVFDQLNIDYP